MSDVVDSGAPSAPPVFTVPTSHLPWLFAQLAKIERRAAKLGVEAPKVVEVPGSRKLVEVTVVDEDEETGRRTSRKMLEERVDLCLERGKPVQLDGWHLVAAIDDDESGRIVRTVPGLACPRELREAPLTRCDHCHTPRYRTACFVVGHEDGRFAFVGRTCLQDFLGGKNPAHLLAVAEMTWALVEACGGGEDGGFGGGRPALVSDLERFLAVTAACARVFGFVTGKQAKEAAERGENKTATSGHVKMFVWPVKTRAKYLADVEVELADELRATSIRDWALEAFAGEPANDFAFNVSQLLTSEIVTPRTAGIAASLYVLHARATEERAKKAARKPSEHVGTVGERTLFAVTVDGVHEHEGNFGVVYIVRMRTVDDAVLVWFASSLEEACGAPIIVPGWSGYLEASVKKHETRKGEAQTVITRAAVRRPWCNPPKAKKARKSTDALTASEAAGIVAGVEGVVAAVRARREGKARS